MIFATIHDIFHPLLQHCGVLATVTLSHIDGYVLASVMNEGHGRDEKLHVISESAS